MQHSFLRLPAWFVPLKKKKTKKNLFLYSVSSELCVCARRAGKKTMFLLYHFFLLCTRLVLHLMVSLSTQAAAYRSRAHFNEKTRKSKI